MCGCEEAIEKSSDPVAAVLAGSVCIDGACLEGSGGFCTTGTVLTTTREPLGCALGGSLTENAARDGGGGVALAVFGTIL